MSNKKLAILGVIAVCMVIWAVVQSKISNKSLTAPSGPTYLIQGLNPDDIGNIVLGTGENEVTLKRQSGRFVVADKDNYPAETKQINDLLTKCLDIKTSQFITDNRENHEALGLIEKEARNVVKFLKPDSSMLTGVIVGKSKEEGQGSYIRLANSDEVYVATETPWIRSKAIDYINQELVSAERENIESITVNIPDGGYTLKRKENSEDLLLENIPADKKLKDSDSKSVFNALTDLKFTDVKKKSSASDELTFDKQYVCRLADSTVYIVSIAQKDEKTYITCQSEFTDTTPVPRPTQDESEEELKKKEAKFLARDSAKEFTAKHKDWIYEIADWKAKNLTKKLSDLLEDKPKTEERAEDEPRGIEQDEKGTESTQKSAEPNEAKAEP